MKIYQVYRLNVKTACHSNASLLKRYRIYRIIVFLLSFQSIVVDYTHFVLSCFHMQYQWIIGFCLNRIYVLWQSFFCVFVLFLLCIHNALFSVYKNWLKIENALNTCYFPQTSNGVWPHAWLYMHSLTARRGCRSVWVFDFCRESLLLFE